MAALSTFKRTGLLWELSSQRTYIESHKKDLFGVKRSTTTSFEAAFERQCNYRCYMSPYCNFSNKVYEINLIIKLTCWVIQILKHELSCKIAWLARFAQFSENWIFLQKMLSNCSHVILWSDKQNIISFHSANMNL